MWRSLFISLGACMVLWSASNCGAAKSSERTDVVENPPFTISDAYSQDWVAGIPEGGSGTNLYVEFESLTKNIDIINFHYNGYFTNAKPLSEAGEYGGYFLHQKRNTQMSSDPTVEAANTPPQRSILSLQEGEAAIEFLQQGKTKYYIIPSLRVEPMLSYPASPPKDDQ
mgnify:CR=1 FL=1|tara:strand:- start:44594 stop:45100 length:507 start_codon:yes stop_codon:yes gene_type:complete